MLRLPAKFLVIVCSFALLLAAADASGKWSGSFSDGSGDGSAYLILKQNGTQLTGTAGPDEERQWPIAKGTVTGTKLTGEVQNPNGTVYKFTLNLEGDKLKGDVEVSRDGQVQTGKLEVSRVK